MADPIVYTVADLDVATLTVDGEARGEPLVGQQAVAWVIRNRATWTPAAWWGHDISGVCKKPWQFSCWNGGPDTIHINNLDPASDEYKGVCAAVSDVFDGNIADPTNGATMYKVSGSKASWDSAVADLPVTIIGRHSFWRLPPT